MSYSVIRGEEAVFGPPSWQTDDLRQVVELRPLGLRHSQANLWRFPPGTQGRRHREPVQEKVFCVLEGTLTVYLGEPAERVELQPHSIVVVEPKTALQIRNESTSDVVFFAYGAPQQPADYKAEKLEDA